MSVIPGGVGAVRSKLASPVSGDKPKTTEDALIKAGETTTEAGTETGLPLFTPVELPDGTVARSQADLDAFNLNPAAPVGATSASVDALNAEIAEMFSTFEIPYNILFELAGNTEIVNNEKPTYLISMVNINIKINKVNNYDFIITVGDSIYSGEIDNIEKSTLKNNDFIVIGLIYTSSEITFTINKQIYKYKTKDKFKVKLGSAPIIINKKGLMNIQLYSFVFYKVLLPSSEYSLFLKHNYYYLSGLNNIINKSSEQPLEIPDKIELRNDIDTRLRELENKIDDKINKKI
jgi:hypothetical protein